jgi:acetylglutamate kinase
MTRHAPDQSLLNKAETLTEALPYLQRYAGQTFVVKYGGHAMGDPEAASDFAEDVVLLKASFVDGLRVTDAETARIAEMVLSGAINKELVSWISRAGGKAIGISGKDGGFVTAEKVNRTTRDPDSNIERIVDLGFVGEPKHIDRSILDTISNAGMIPVIAPIGVGEDGHTYNINADTMAGAVAAAMGAARLFLLTDVAGVLDKEGNLLPDLDPAQIHALRANGTVTGGMIPKLETCIAAVEGGAEAAVILDGRVPHVTLLEIFTKGGAGTLVHR